VCFLFYIDLFAERMKFLLWINTGVFLFITGSESGFFFLGEYRLTLWGFFFVFVFGWNTFIHVLLPWFENGVDRRRIVGGFRVENG
jgi:hypothetical protein